MVRAAVVGGPIPTFVLDAFSAPSSGPLTGPGDDSQDADLWSTEAVHRANNLAQLSASLTSYCRRQGVYDLDNVERLTRDLTALYAELGAITSRGDVRACAEPLRRLVVDLVALFGPITGTVAQVRATQLALDPERHRALLLIASELVINALRHAFPEGGGLILVTLSKNGPEAQLRVCDNGVGRSEVVSLGMGSQLIKRLSAMLDGQLSIASEPGWGTRVDLSFPAAVDAQPVHPAPAPAPHNVTLEEPHDGHHTR